jgi:Ribbon-helix-helix protein, copG family
MPQPRSTPPEHKRNTTMQFAVSEYEKAKIEALVREANVTKSEMIRRLIAAGVKALGLTDPLEKNDIA